MVLKVYHRLWVRQLLRRRAERAARQPDPAPGPAQDPADEAQEGQLERAYAHMHGAFLLRAIECGHGFCSLSLWWQVGPATVSAKSLTISLIIT